MTNEPTYGSTDILVDEEARSPETSPEQAAESAIEGSDDDELKQKELRAKRISCCQKLVLASIIIGFIIFVIIDTSTTGYLKSGINTFLKWIQRHAAAGFFAFMAVYFIATGMFKINANGFCLNESKTK